MRWLNQLWRPWRCARFGLAALLLASCASDNVEPPEWWFGGQTGSLMPLCGLTPAARDRGVPASAPGLVLLSTRCEDASALEAVTVRDATGQPIPYRLQALPNGEVLVVFAGSLPPGDYQIDIPQPSEEDGGMEPEPEPQTVTVEQSAPEPTRFGEVARVFGECGGMLEFAPDAEVLPYLSLLSVEYQIDGGPITTLIVTGTLDVEADGRAHADLPMAELQALGDGEHQLRVIVQLAGENAPLETFLLALHVPCGEAGSEAEQTGTCSTMPGQSTDTGALLLIAAAVAMAVCKRKQR